MRAARSLLPAALFLLLTACGGGDDGASLATITTPDSPGTVTVTPALGQVWMATVRVRRLDGVLLAEGRLGSDGDIVLPTRSSGGLIVEIEGNDGAYYFDEGAGAARRLATGQVLHAVSAGPRTRIAVTALTEIVYQRARERAAAGPLTAAHVTAAEADVASLFGAPESGSFLDAPEQVNDARDLPDATTPAGRAALLLAGLANYAFGRAQLLQPACASTPDCAPLPPLIADLATDFRDGQLDGIADGAPLASTFYSSANAANLPAELETAITAFQTRATAARAIPTSDSRIGQRYAGRHPLHCERDGGSQTADMELVIASDGGFELNGSLGQFSLPAGSSASALQEPGSNLGYLRSGFRVANTVLPLDAPVSDGLSINLGGNIGPFPVMAPPTPHPNFVSAGRFSATGGFLIEGGREWQCEGFPMPTAEPDTSLLASWLPDGGYDCETEDPGTIVHATVSAGSISIGDSGWAYTGALQRNEETPHALNAAPDLETHLHSLDSIARARMPLLVMNLAQNAPPALPGNQLRLRRSLLSGETYFNLVLNGVNYQHCLANAPTVSMLGDSYTRGGMLGGINVISGYLGVMTGGAVSFNGTTPIIGTSLTGTSIPYIGNTAFF